MQKTLPFEQTQVGLALVMLAAAVSFVLSVSLWFSGDRDAGIFVGLWVPSILSLAALVRGGVR